MSASDGHRIASSGSGFSSVACTRWTELTDAMRFHAGLAQTALAPTEFRLLNGAAPIVVGRPDDGASYNALMALLQRPPGGGTPLCKHIRDVIEQIRFMEPQLRANAQRAVVMIATDGESSDGDIAMAMKPLEQLPVWVVIRLCTDDDKVVSYWNNIDKNLELDMDILDDIVGEAKEIYEVNDWITYGEPLHRLREWGVNMRELDLIDEASLSGEQMRVVCTMLLGMGPASELPHPDLDFDRFAFIVREATKKEPPVLDPVSLRMRSWIDVSALKRRYSKNKNISCAVM